MGFNIILILFVSVHSFKVQPSSWTDKNVIEAA